MDEQDLLAERFEGHRARLRAVAYRMLGSPAEADDAAQEAWLRLSRSGAGGIDNLGGWLTTVVARVCLNMMLRSRRSRREETLEGPLGEPLRARVPDPIVGRPDGADPEQEALLADGVGLAIPAEVSLAATGSHEFLCFDVDGEEPREAVFVHPEEKDGDLGGAGLAAVDGELVVAAVEEVLQARETAGALLLAPVHPGPNLAQLVEGGVEVPAGDAALWMVAAGKLGEAPGGGQPVLAGVGDEPPRAVRLGPRHLQAFGGL